MATLANLNPFSTFTELDGDALDNGYIYIGVANQNPKQYPVTVYWDERGTIPAQQPLRTNGGYVTRNGKPAQVYVNSSYSLIVEDKKHKQVFYVANYVPEELRGSLQKIANYSALRAYTGIDTSILVLGRSSSNDGGLGIFFYDASDTTSPDNDGTIIVTVDGKRFKREIEQDFHAAWFGVSGSSADNTSALQSAINTAFLFGTPGVMQAGAFSVRVVFPRADNINILGTVLIPGGIDIDINGCRLIGGDASAGTTLFSGALQSMFKTARWNGSALVSNHDAPNETTYRVLNAKIKNGSFLNVGCPLDLVNFQEHCEIQDIFFDNVSAIVRTKGSFYARYGDTGKLLARNSSLASGQPAMLIYGAAAHDLKIDISAPSASVTVHVTATNSFRVELSGSCEEGYANNSIGILNDGAYCQAWTVRMYCEGVRVGIKTINNGTFNACDFSPAYFSSTEYSVLAGINGFRASCFDATSAPDEGAGIRNIMDFSAFNNDVIVRIPAKAGDSVLGPSAFPTNILLSGQAVSSGQSVWRETSTPTDTLGLSTSALANQNQLSSLPFEGRQIKTIVNQVPFCTITRAVNTITVDTQIKYDTSNMLAFNFYGNTDSINYALRGFLFGGVVLWAERNPVGATVTVSDNGGNVRLVFNGVTAAVPVININGCVRHI